MNLLGYGGKMVYYFAYGSNMDEGQMKERLKKEPQIVGFGVIKGCKLCFNKSPGGYANIVKDLNGEVYGIVYKVSNKDLEIIDKYEGVPEHYIQEKISVEVKGKEHECQTYKAVRINNLLRPSKDYFNKIINALEKNKFPLNYIERIKECI